MFFNEFGLEQFSSQSDGHIVEGIIIAQKTKHPMEATLEEHIEVLEKQVASLLLRLGLQPTQKDWQGSVGMFADDPVMAAIQKEGQKIREADRKTAHRDNP